MTATARQREFTGRHMVIWIVSFFAVIIAVNLTMAWFANSTWSGLIVKNGYVASQSFGKELERARAQEALGWKAEVIHDVGSLTLRFSDRAGAALGGLTVTGMLRSPVTEKHDQSLEFSGRDGGYVAMANLTPGFWDIEINAASASGESYRKTFRFQVKG